MIDAFVAHDMSQYSTFGRRIWSALFDAGFLMLCGAIVALLCSSERGPRAYITYLSIYLVVSYGYSIVTTYLLGGTFGKRLFSLRVVTEPSQNRVSLTQSFLREILNVALSAVNIVLIVVLVELQGPVAIRSYLVRGAQTVYSEISSYLSSALAVAELLTCLMSAKRRAIHDLVAGTVVVKSGSIKWYVVLLTLVLFIVGMIVFYRAYALLKSSALLE
jgi:uncharacterized RDD family membrane protein YckC